ncbi:MULTISPECIES: hypothetical protein [Clavibacter]|uniref:hypothetical protein n=1 Tax=Clavibacter TaxID=1573 RepID=UPI0020C818D7|nr:MULTISPECIES: hypothetical protein [Clavibacter]MDA3803326.1 hypothetical protein [Clavibacter sp. CT19]
MSVDDNGVDHRRARRRSRLIACLAVWAVALGVGLVGTGVVGGPAEPAQAASGADFDPGMIISDAKFFDGAVMSQRDVQTFLQARVPRCASGYVCLTNYVQDTPARDGDSRCSSLQASRMSAADVVYWVGRACGVSQAALLVLLEKEQGLVTDSTPTDRQFRSATGYGCPDTAACDSTYYGFFNQVYNAARQFKVYQSTPTRWNYQAGRVNTILWHPNAACGSSQVTIRNQATAGLYIYTPYRPNSAALANLYGTGDSCSSYGNRNFWRLYTDWFGSTSDGPVSSFVKTATDDSVYLVSGGQKHPITDFAVFQNLSALGGISTVSRSYLDALATGNVASELVRDPSDGTVSLVQGDRRHPFTSCALVGDYGYGCGDAVNLDPGQLASVPAAGNMSAYFVLPGSGTAYLLEGGVKYPLSSWSALVGLNSGASPFVATMRASVGSRYATGHTALEPGTLAKSPAGADVYLINGLNSKVGVPSFAVTQELGFGTSFANVAAQTLDGYTRSTANLSLLVRCGGVTSLATQGRVVAVANPGSTGLPVTDLVPTTCRALDATGGTVQGPVFVKGIADSTVFLLQGGQAKPVTSWARLVALAGTSSPTITTLRDAAVARIAVGADA